MQSVLSPDNQKLGHYQIVDEAGRGGMSVVYEAQDTRIGRRVALKVLAVPHSLTAEPRLAMITRLKREARAIASLSHPNVVTIHDIGEENDQHYIVMEYLDGETLRTRLSREPIPPAEIPAILSQVAAGLDAVHAAGIVHRDIKPSNIMLLPGGSVKLMDFGVARQTEDTMVTQAGMIVGSPTYMSPEQINGDTPSSASDVWSLGVILYEMLAGRPPFEGGTIPRMLYQVSHNVPPRLPEVSSAVQRVLDRALDKSPERRYPSAGALAAAYSAAAPALPAPAPRQPRTPRARVSPPFPPAPSRHPLAWVVGLLLLLVISAALIPVFRPRPAAIHAPAAEGQTPAAVAPRRAARRTHRLAFVSPTRSAAPETTPAEASRRADARAEEVRAEEVRAEEVRARAAKEEAARAEAVRAQTARKKAIAARAEAARVEVARKKAAQSEATRREAAQAEAAREETAGKADAGEAARPAPVRRSRRRVAPAAQVASRPAAPSPAPIEGQTGRDDQSGLLGTWHGQHSHHPATLTITRREGDAFTGTMSVRTPEAQVRIAVTGRVSPRTGEFTMRETRILSSTRPRAWDLGSETGRLGRSGQMSGTGTDIKGRAGAWSFSR